MKSMFLALSVLTLASSDLAFAQRGPGFGRPDFDRHHHDHGPVCFAQNAVGRRFPGYGYDERDAMHDALDNCRAGSIFGVACHPAGCR